jgi:hypothetical protein
VKNRIITAYAERASGPGWANAPLWVIEQDSNGKITERCIQPSKFTAEIHSLYDISQAAHIAMLNAVISSERKKKGGKP